MFRRKKKSESAPPDEAETAAMNAVPSDPQNDATDDTPAGAQMTATSDAGATASAPPEPVEDPEPGRAAIAFAEAPAPVAVDPADEDLVPAPAEAKQRRSRYAPREDLPVSASGGEEHLPVSYWLGSVQSVLTKSGTSSAEDRERQAADDFRAAIMPGLMGLRDAVPDAASPDEALRVLAEREAAHEYPEDPEADSLSQRDIFRTDSSVYYRIRNRFEKPRRRVGWGDPWRPPPGLARPDPPHRALNRGE